MTINTAGHVALLAPVPHEHLIDGADVVCAEGRVAFGSRAWEVFRELDGLRKGLAVDVYLYASHLEPPDPLEASWRARYVGHVESVGSAHPAGMRYRPPSTAKYPNDNSGHWAVFWEVDDLAELPTHRRIQIAQMTGFGKPKRYGHPFVPEGPILIEHP
jgi:hypothetical protein